jgi:hypothetical protein
VLKNAPFQVAFFAVGAGRPFLEIEGKRGGLFDVHPVRSSPASSARMAAVVLAAQPLHGLPAADLLRTQSVLAP